MKLFIFATSLTLLVGSVVGEGIGILNAESGRRLFAQTNKSWQKGFGAGPRGSTFYSDQKWLFEETACEDFSIFSGDGPCYVIRNERSNRRIYAQKDKDGSNGVGADNGPTVWADQKWVLEETDCSGQICYFIKNAHSGRRLYAKSNQNWSNGVGAHTGTNENQKWLIDITIGKSCVDFDSLKFPDCSFGTIETTISKSLPSDCEHDVTREMELLTKNTDPSQLEFKLQNMCRGYYTCINQWNDIEVNGCTYDTIVDAVEKILPGTCDHDAETELQYYTSSDNLEETKEAISVMCSEGWDDVDTSDFDDINVDFDDSFMNEYVAGDTYLNKETGSFQGTVIGEDIDNFRDDGATNTILQDVPSLESCDYQSIMCCFGRDRQANDNNGNCNDDRCGDADPADNSNLCFTEHDDQPFPGETEGDIHCHGLAWADDLNDFTAQLRMNNFFYVSLYDHMYTRGYVENMVDSAEVPMCACIEDMPPVSRSDCTQIDASLTFKITFSLGQLEAIPQNDLDVEFNACQGTNFSNGANQNNDLASYVHRLTLEGKINSGVREEVFKTLVGYAEPGDNENEGRCAEAYEDRIGTEYPNGIQLVNFVSGRRLYAQNDKQGESGFGAGAPSTPEYDDQLWHLKTSACQGDYAGEGPCYEIINGVSGRRIYAQKNKNFESGAGAYSGYVYADQKWILEPTDCDGQECYFITNAYSGRRLFAQNNKEWESGVGAYTGTRYNDQKWFINLSENYENIVL